MVKKEPETPKTGKQIKETDLRAEGQDCLHHFSWARQWFAWQRAGSHAA
jgi:hypothetical protein